MTALFCWLYLAFRRNILKTPRHYTTTWSIAAFFEGQVWTGVQSESGLPSKHSILELTNLKLYQPPQDRKQHAQMPWRAFFHPLPVSSSPHLYLHKIEKGNTESSKTHFFFLAWPIPVAGESLQCFCGTLFLKLTHNWVFLQEHCCKGSSASENTNKKIFCSLTIFFS